MKIVFTLAIFIFSLKLIAQGQTIDSLKVALKNAKHDTLKVTILSQLNEMCEVEDILIYAEPCVEICEKSLSKPESLNNRLKEFYLMHLAGALNNIGFLAENEGNVAKAIDYYTRSLKIDEKLNNKSGVAYSLNNLASMYENQGDIINALECYHRSLKLMEQIQDKTGMAQEFNNLGFIYNKQGDVSKALEYHYKALKIREELKDKKGVSYSLNNIGTIYSNQAEANHNPDSLLQKIKLVETALSYFEKCLKIREELNDKRGIATVLHNIGFMYKNKGDIQKALEYYHRSLKIREEIKDKKGIAISLNNMSGILFRQGKINEALDYSLKSLAMAQQLGYPENINHAASLLKEIYQKQNKYKEALEMYELEIQMRDSINNAETKKASVKKQFQYEYEKKAAADSVKHNEEQKVKNAQLTAQQAQLKQEKTQRWALYGGLLLVIVFSGFVFNRFKITQKQKVIIEKQKTLVDAAYEQLHEKNKEVMDSITYARRIQRALITSEMYIEKTLNRLVKKD